MKGQDYQVVSGDGLSLNRGPLMGKVIRSTRLREVSEFQVIRCPLTVSLAPFISAKD